MVIVMNVSDCFDVAIGRELAQKRAIEERERQIFFNKCLRHIDGEDAYAFLTQKAARLLGFSKPNPGVYVIVNYFFDNLEHFDCSFEEWLQADNGPLVRYGLKGLFPELELISSNEHEIAKMAKEFYGISIETDWEGDYWYSLEFDFRELNSKRVKLDEVQEMVKSIILEKLEGGR